MKWEIIGVLHANILGVGRWMIPMPKILGAPAVQPPGSNSVCAYERVSVYGVVSCIAEIRITVF